MYTRTEFDLVRDWAQYCFELLGFINKVTGTDEPGSYPPPPTGLDEIKHSELRAWFMEQQVKVIPIWIEFVTEMIRDLTSRNNSVVNAEELDRFDQHQTLDFLDRENLLRRASRWRDTRGIYIQGESMQLTNLETDEDFQEAIKNPFIRYYYPGNLYELAWNLGLQSGVDNWQPDQNKTGRLRAELISVADITNDFVEWVKQRTSDTY